MQGLMDESVNFSTTELCHVPSPPLIVKKSLLVTSGLKKTLKGCKSAYYVRSAPPNPLFEPQQSQSQSKSQSHMKNGKFDMELPETDMAVETPSKKTALFPSHLFVNGGSSITLTWNASRESQSQTRFVSCRAFFPKYCQHAQSSKSEMSRLLR